MTIEIRRRLEKALARSGPPSSDYDLNADVKPPSERPLRPAGVLVAVSSRPSGSVILLTKRAPTLKHHPGQIAFPGGKVDDGDKDPTAAALREAREEIGLPSDMIDVIGCLPPHETVTGFQVTPVLALVDQFFKPIPEPSEVAEIFEVPLAHILDRDRYSIQSRRWRGTRRAYFTVPWGPYYIWGATARMLCALADRVADETD